MKPVYFTLRYKGFETVGYINDTYLKGRTFYDCEVNITNTVKWLRDLGLTLNMAKSVFIPTQCITFLGFVLNSNEMTVSLTPTKAIKLQSKTVELLNTTSPTIRAVRGYRPYGYQFSLCNVWTSLL